MSTNQSTNLLLWPVWSSAVATEPPKSETLLTISFRKSKILKVCTHCFLQRQGCKVTHTFQKLEKVKVNTRTNNTCSKSKTIPTFCSVDVIYTSNHVCACEKQKAKDGNLMRQSTLSLELQIQSFQADTKLRWDASSSLGCFIWPQQNGANFILLESASQNGL